MSEADRNQFSAPARVGILLRTAREQRGMTLAQVADAVGCAKSYLSAIENGHRTAPGDEVLSKIELVLGMQADLLLTAGRWQRSLEAGGVHVQRDVAAMQRDGMATQQLRAMLAKNGSIDELYRSGELAKFASRLTPDVNTNATPLPLPLEVPLINSVAAGYPTEFTDLGYPARVADEYVRCPDLHDADAFAARVVGDSMEPTYVEGDVVVFSPARQVRSGSDCFVRIEPDHQTTFKRVYFEQAPDPRDKTASPVERIRLQPLNNKYAPQTYEREQVAGLYAAVSVIRKIE
jgi:SOS-response transcriptional repressor LexA/DNA-binding XRE family transcriptional regulator